MDRGLVNKDLRAAFDRVRARPGGKATDVHRLRSIIGNATAIDLSTDSGELDCAMCMLIIVWSLWTDCYGAGCIVFTLYLLIDQGMAGLAMKVPLRWRWQ